jgi:ATP-dependent Lon protease
MGSLNEKIKRVFNGSGILIDKSLQKNIHELNRVPRFVSDFMISTLVSPGFPAQGFEKIRKLLSENFVDSSKKELIKSRIKDQGSYNLIGFVKVRYDIQTEEYFAEIPSLGENGVRITYNVLQQHSAILLSGGAWGNINVLYETCHIKKKNYPFVITNFIPMQITKIDLKQYIDRRSSFLFDEWMDLIVSSIGINPLLVTKEEKLLYITRLVPMVESNTNLLELGPPESGKTFTYRNISNNCLVISGSNTSVASLFYNKLTKQLGGVGTKDLILFDEITNSKFKNNDEVINLLKDYMSTGCFSRGDKEFRADTSIVFAGNIICDRETKSVRSSYRHLFSPLPETIRNDRAFLDRIHGFIPGWIAPQINSDITTASLGFMSDYLGEIFHQLRSKNYIDKIKSRVIFEQIGARDEGAILKLISGFIKVLSPDFNLNKEELDLIVKYSVSLRQRVLDQLRIVSPGEFSGAEIKYRVI